MYPFRQRAGMPISHVHGTWMDDRVTDSNPNQPKAIGAPARELVPVSYTVARIRRRP